MKKESYHLLGNNKFLAAKAFASWSGLTKSPDFVLFSLVPWFELGTIVYIMSHSTNPYFVILCVCVCVCV
jgi:hypothetical protein